MSVIRTHHRFSVAEYDQMIDRGILTEDDRVELIRGEIVEKMSIGDEHIACVNRLTRLLVKLFDERAIVSVQNPVRLADSEPEPDLVLLTPKADFYASGKPQAADVLLLIEVADSSLELDREDKRSLYAENGIQEYWIINLIDRTIETFRQPQENGRYLNTRVVRPGANLEIGALAGSTIEVSQIL